MRLARVRSAGGEGLGGFCLGGDRKGCVLGAAEDDVDQQGAHDGGACPHGPLPAVNEGLLGYVEQVLGVRAGVAGCFDGVGNAVAGGVRGSLRDAVQPVVDGAAVAVGQQRLRTGGETVTDLKILTGRRTDLVADRTRTVNRLRAQLTGTFPGLERALDLTDPGPLTLLTGYQTPASLRRAGKKRLEAWLRNRKVLRADRLAETALEAAGRQHTPARGETDRSDGADARAGSDGPQPAGRRARQGDRGPISRTSGLRSDHQHSGPGRDPRCRVPGRDRRLHDHLRHRRPSRRLRRRCTVPHDSGKISGNLRRSRRYNRRLQRVFYISALFSIRSCDESRRFYERKRAEGKRHTQAVLALARRQVNVLWALLRDGRTYELVPPIALAA